VTLQREIGSAICYERFRNIRVPFKTQFKNNKTPKKVDYINNKKIKTFLLIKFVSIFCFHFQYKKEKKSFNKNN
jgi:hypothetical protein